MYIHCVELREEVQKKVDKLMEPPPVKAPKPLPKPDDAPRKKRGGRRQVQSGLSHWPEESGSDLGEGDREYVREIDSIFSEPRH